MTAIVAGLLLLFSCLAHAAGLATANPTSSSPPTLDWQTWVMLGLAALGGVRVIVDALLAFFKAEAPLTKTTIDDSIRDGLQLAHDKLDRLAGRVDRLIDATKPTGGVRVVPGSGTAATLAVVLLGALAAPALTGCSAAQRTALEHAAWDCTAPARADAVAAVTPAVVSVIKAAGSADGKAIDLSTVKAAIAKANILSEAGILLSCATASAIAILTAPPPAPAPGAPQSAPYELDPAAVRATWAAVKREQLGGADFRVAGGAVL